MSNWENHKFLGIHNRNGEDAWLMRMECYMDDNDFLSIDTEHPEQNEYTFAYLDLEEAKRLYAWLGDTIRKWDKKT